ncbi:MAG: hypothetical protein AB7E55_16765 [Pigmentiphaga sp.]
MTDLAAWIAENTIVCERYRLRLAPSACKACQMATPERCEGCERTKGQPQLTPRQAQHRRGALNAVKSRRRNAMKKQEETTVGLTAEARKIPVQSEWRGGLRQALREIAGEAVLLDSDPRIVRLVRCCHFLAEQVAVRDEVGAMKVFEEASEILGR